MEKGQRSSKYPSLHMMDDGMWLFAHRDCPGLKELAMRVALGINEWSIEIPYKYVCEFKDPNALKVQVSHRIHMHYQIYDAPGYRWIAHGLTKWKSFEDVK